MAVLAVTGLGLAITSGLLRQGQKRAAMSVPARRTPLTPPKTASGNTDVAVSPIRSLPVSGTPLTPASARALARNWFQQRDPAAAGNVNQTMKSLETGDAYRVDSARTQQILCGCESPRHLHELLSVRVVLPEAPARSFVAQFETITVGPQERGRCTVVFVARSGTWRAAIVVWSQVDAQGFHQGPGQPHDSKNSANSLKLLNELGAYVHEARTTGHLPTSTHHAWTGDAQTIADDYISEGQDRANSHGVYRHFSIPAATSSAYAFHVAEGELVCGALASRVLLTAPHGQMLVQDLGQENWGTTLPPGSYAALVQSFDDQVCMIVHPDGTRDVTPLYGTSTDLKPAATPRV